MQHDFPEAPLFRRIAELLKNLSADTRAPPSLRHSHPTDTRYRWMQHQASGANHIAFRIFRCDVYAFRVKIVHDNFYWYVLFFYENICSNSRKRLMLLTPFDDLHGVRLCWCHVLYGATIQIDRGAS